MSGEQAVLNAYPELRRLAALRDLGGGTFERADIAPGATVRTIGIRVWPNLAAEALAIGGRTDALTLRLHPNGKIVSKRDDDLTSALDGLLAGILVFVLRSQP